MVLWYNCWLNIRRGRTVCACLVLEKNIENNWWYKTCLLLCFWCILLCFTLEFYPMIYHAHFSYHKRDLCNKFTDLLKLNILFWVTKYRRSEFWACLFILIESLTRMYFLKSCVYFLWLWWLLRILILVKSVMYTFLSYGS